MKKTAVILGTRPEIIKMSPVIRALRASDRPYVLVHTGQHWSFEMDQAIFDDLELPAPAHKFTRPPDLGANAHEKLVAWMTDSIRAVLDKEKPGSVLVQGDTDTVLAGARAATAAGGITIGHVEAGLRSYDLNMPEERNRIEADKLSHILFAPTESARKNLERENLGSKRIEVTGNTIVDALHGNLAIAEKKAAAPPKGYALVTLHRPESVDSTERLGKVVRALNDFAKEKGLKIVFPVHPRTQLRLREQAVALDPAVFLTPPPMGFLDFIRHEKSADIILTDSGGVQEEACILGVPCVTIRTTTERPETVDVGANVIAGYEPGDILSAARAMIGKRGGWRNPFGDGKASERILKALES